MAKEDPLSEFQLLSDRILKFVPQEVGETIPPASNSGSAPSPDLVVLFAWAYAQPRHIAKYTRGYQKLYPKARILLLFNTVHNMTWVPDWVQMKELQPAVSSIDEFLAHYYTGSINRASRDIHTKEPTILFHIFSNGGAHLAVQLEQAYRDNLRASATLPTSANWQLPISTLIFDSCPGHARFATAGKTTLSFLPKTAVMARIIGMPIAYAFLGACYILHFLGIAEHVVIKLWRNLNDPKGTFLFRRSRRGDSELDRSCKDEPLVPELSVIPRTYIYSQVDDMIPPDDVLEHVAIARQNSSLPEDKAKEVVRAEEFSTSAHVNHVSLDQERYWKIVNEAVERSI